MCMNKEKNNVCCCIYSIITALIAGIGIAAVFYEGLLVSIVGLVNITLALAIIEILVMIFKAVCGKNCGSKNSCGTCLIPIIIGSIVTTVFAILSTGLPTFSITAALLVGGIAFFFVSNLIAIITTIAGKTCDDKCHGYND